MKAILKIPNFSNYEIYPKDGVVWSLKMNRFIGSISKDGYWKTSLVSDDGNIWKTNLHRIIYTACYGDIPNDLQVNHIDEDKSNNSIFNLNLMTCKENVNWGRHNEKMATTLLGNVNKKGKYNNSSSKAVGAYKDGKLVMTFPSTREAHRNGYLSSCISCCCRGKLKLYKGFEWKYLEIEKVS